jgi:hypothetical protein
MSRVTRGTRSALLNPRHVLYFQKSLLIVCALKAAQARLDQKEKSLLTDSIKRKKNT